MIRRQIKRSLPEHVSPMLAVLSEMPKNPSEYAFEFKWDGYRALCFWDGRKIRLESRNQLDFLERYPEIKSISSALSRPAILDGEIVALNEKGYPDFGMLQRRTELFNRYIGPKAAEHIKIMYVVFDVIYEGSGLLTNQTYAERREILEGLKLSDPKWKTSPVTFGEGEEMYKIADEHQLEGLIAKKVSSRYEEGKRSPHWRKIKIIQNQEFVIAGWQPGEGLNTGGIKSILLGYYQNGKFKYAGNVGTGFSSEDRVVLRRYFEERESGVNPFNEPVKGKKIRFVIPETVAEIEFRGWTADLKVRQGAFKGLRDDKDPRKVIRETKSA